MKRKNKVILTTGGTGGHIYPALAVAEELKNNGVECIFVGTSHRMEKDLCSKEYKFYGLDIIPLSKSLKSFWLMFKGIFSAIKILKKEGVDCVIGFGNYISLPILIASFLTGRAIYLQEQNVNLGLANKVFYRFSKKIFLPFEKTYDSLPIKRHKKLKVTGNPLRKEIYNLTRTKEREKLKMTETEKLILITGGSLGAKAINDGILKRWDNLFENKKVRIYWATGEANFEEINKQITKYKPNDVIKPYLDNMLQVMSAADLIICRAGALTISEIIELSIPAILIPYGSEKVGQYDNAKLLEEQGAAYVYKNSEVGKGIEKAFELLADDQKRESMQDAFRNLKTEEPSKKIVQEMGYAKIGE